MHSIVRLRYLHAAHSSRGFPFFPPSFLLCLFFFKILDLSPSHHRHTQIEVRETRIGLGTYIISLNLRLRRGSAASSRFLRSRQGYTFSDGNLCIPSRLNQPLNHGPFKRSKSLAVNALMNRQARESSIVLNGQK